MRLSEDKQAGNRRFKVAWALLMMINKRDHTKDDHGSLRVTIEKTRGETCVALPLY
jgi:hypothetical protein